MTDLEITRQTAIAYNTLDPEIFNDLLSDDFEYSNDVIFGPISGKQNFQVYITVNFEVIKRAGIKLFVELAFLQEKPCLILAQVYKEDKSAYVTLDFNNGKIKRIKYINIPPHQIHLYGTGDYPGLVENPQDRYMSETIIPAKEDFLYHCKKANIQFEKLKGLHTERNLRIIDWRMKYMTLDNFHIPEEFEENEEALLFKMNYDDSIYLFYKLLEQMEEENDDERVNISFNASINGCDSNFLLATALSPTDETKYDIYIANKALLDDRYYAFYIDGGITDMNLPLLEGKFDVEPKLLVINEDGKVINSVENRAKTELKRQVMGILILNKREFQSEFNTHINSETTFKSERVQPANKYSTKKKSAVRRQIKIDFEIDLPIKGGNGNSFYNAVIIEKAILNNDYVKTEYDYLKYIGLGRGIDWKIISQEVLSKHGRTMDKIKIETTETTPDGIITQVENYYFDITECFINQ